MERTLARSFLSRDEAIHDKVKENLESNSMMRRDEMKNGKREDRSSDDEFEKIFERKIKKKTKTEKSDENVVSIEMEGEQFEPRSGTSIDFEDKESDVFPSKKGATTTRISEKFDNSLYTDEYPRRSLREKREPPKSFDKKLYG